MKRALGQYSGPIPGFMLLLPASLRMLELNLILWATGAFKSPLLFFLTDLNQI